MKLVRDDVRLYLITGTVDMRMGIDGYIAVVQNRLHMNVFDNSIFLFCNKTNGLKKETISNGFVMKKIIRPQSPRSSTDG